MLSLTSFRPSLALTLIITAASASVTVLGIHAAFTHRVFFGLTTEPLAPAPAPPAPPQVHAKSHHLAASISRLNPLRGLASWYGDMWHGRKTASGEPFDETKLTAAHNTLPLGTLVRVTNLASMRSVIVKINDRGSLAPHRVIDLSSAAAREIGILDNGLARVKLEILSKL